MGVGPASIAFIAAGNIRSLTKPGSLSRSEAVEPLIVLTVKDGDGPNAETSTTVPIRVTPATPTSERVTSKAEEGSLGSCITVPITVDSTTAT